MHSGRCGLDLDQAVGLHGCRSGCVAAGRAVLRSGAECFSRTAELLLRRQRRLTP